MKRRRGYICCGTQMIAESTRKPSANLIVRYRKCPVCGIRIRTEERISKGQKKIIPNNGTDSKPTAD